MPIIHGIKVSEINNGARAIAAVSTAIIGLIATSSDPDQIEFPNGVPVLVTDINAAIAKVEGTGTLKPALEAIADQCSPVVVVVRVTPVTTGDDAEEETQAAITAGAQALLLAESTLGVRPRILGAPGLDTQEVTNALVTVAQKLRAFTYAAASGEEVEDILTYAENFAQRELMLIWPEFSDWSGSAVARALGLRARIDSETGWHKTLSNVAVNGVTGIEPAVDFDLLGGASTASLLNDANVTTLIRASGFRFWGNRTMSDDPLFAFESVVRTAQVLQDEIAGGLLWAIDKPITAGLVKDIVETVNGRFRQLVTQGRIIGARCWFDASANPASALAAGSITIDYEYTPCAPAEAIMLNQRITDKFYATIADQLG